jgi:DNA-binding NtrC family response regulator
MSATILIVDDEENARQNISTFLASQGYETIGVATLADARQGLRQGKGDIILLDVQLPDGYGPDLLEEVACMPMRPPVILITAFGDIEMAVEAMKNGAHDFLQKPIRLAQLEKSILRAMEIVAMRRELDHLRQSRYEKADFIVGSTPIMHTLLSQAQRAAEASVSVLITGETGTGKELVARAVHAQSPRCFAPFIAINCGAFTEQLLESELFGHEKGAFTDAQYTKKGRLEMANAGTLFLDEVGDISMRMQIDLLRVLETREFSRVGGTATLHSDFRVIAATNQDLEEAIRQKTFRRDLFYRLNVIHLQVPPLRERPEDIPLLAEHFLWRYATETNKKIDSIEPTAMEAMRRYPWPGNVRELENAIERAVVLGKTRQIKLSDLPLAIPLESAAEVEKLSLEEVERQHIARVLATGGGNLSNVAKILRINRSTLYQKIKKYGLAP